MKSQEKGEPKSQRRVAKRRKVMLVGTCSCWPDVCFLARMEQLLWLYAQPYDLLIPVVCFDERSCFLIGESLLPFPLRAGQVVKEHYAYTKHGSLTTWGN